MKRRRFMRLLGSACAIALAPVAMNQSRLQVIGADFGDDDTTVVSWWMGDGWAKGDGLAVTTEQMNRIWRECSRQKPYPDVIVATEEAWEQLRRYWR